jgi:hypothetical protein
MKPRKTRPARTAPLSPDAKNAQALARILSKRKGRTAPGTGSLKAAIARIQNR